MKFVLVLSSRQKFKQCKWKYTVTGTGTNFLWHVVILTTLNQLCHPKTNTLFWSFNGFPDAVFPLIFSLRTIGWKYIFLIYPENLRNISTLGLIFTQILSKSLSLVKRNLNYYFELLPKIRLIFKLVEVMRRDFMFAENRYMVMVNNYTIYYFYIDAWYWHFVMFSYKYDCPRGTVHVIRCQSSNLERGLWKFNRTPGIGRRLAVARTRVAIYWPFNNCGAGHYGTWQNAFSSTFIQLKSVCHSWRLDCLLFARHQLKKTCGY